MDAVPAGMGGVVVVVCSAGTGRDGDLDGVGPTDSVGALFFRAVGG